MFYRSVNVHNFDFFCLNFVCCIEQERNLKYLSKLSCMNICDFGGYNP